MTKTILLYFLTCMLCATTVYSQEKETTSKTELPAGWWQIPKSPVIFTFGGYIKADMIHDFDAIGSPDFFDVSTIPTDGTIAKPPDLM